MSALAAAPADEAPRERIRERALAGGFDVVGFSPIELAPAARDNLAAYLARGYHGEMRWLAARSERRAAPAVLWPAARSVIVLGVSYAPDADPLAALGAADRGVVSVYARGRDYHLVLGKRLRALARWMTDSFDCAVKLFTDTAPVMEKPLAARAGLGWQGKHTNLVSRDHGSWLFLGEIYTTLALAADDAHADRCGRCRRCLDVCPTDAFPAPYELDARRCISYLTIEHAGPIDRSLRPLMGNRIFGCDDCLAVCPWNKFARASHDAELGGRAELGAFRLSEYARLDDAEFRRRFSRTAIKRTGRDRFVRNVAIALGNVGGPAEVSVVRELLDDTAPVVRGAAVWALSRLLAHDAFARLAAAHLPGEADADVRAEWQAATPARAAQ